MFTGSLLGPKSRWPKISETGNDITNWVLVNWPCFKTKSGEHLWKMFYSPRFSKANSKFVNKCQQKRKYYIKQKRGESSWWTTFIATKPLRVGRYFSHFGGTCSWRSPWVDFGYLVPLIVNCGKEIGIGKPLFPYTSHTLYRTCW